MKKQPWYKRAVIWLLIAGATVAGAFIAFGRWSRRVVFRAPPVPDEREATNQRIEDEIRAIDQRIEAMSHEPKEIHDTRNKSIDALNSDLAQARELRRAKRNLITRIGNRRADRLDD